MNLFVPKTVFFEPKSLDYPLGIQLYEHFQKMHLNPQMVPTHNRITGIGGHTSQEKYLRGKETLVVGVKKDMHFATCKPSAHYQFPLVTGCPGHCQYCYLQTSLGQKPYIRIYVNIEEIFQSIEKHIAKHLPAVTLFEASSSADPLALEHLTGSLAKTIEFFGRQPNGRLRFVTKFINVDTLLNLPHHGHTRIRFSINSDYVLNNFEFNTPPLKERLSAANKVLAAQYPLGFIIAPIMIYPNWQQDYANMFTLLNAQLTPQENANITFELITHRYTISAKKLILERFPNTKLDMIEATRQIKFGKFGRSKYVYKKEDIEQIKDFMAKKINQYFPQAKIEYLT